MNFKASYIIIAIAIVVLISVEFIIEMDDIMNLREQHAADQKKITALIDSLQDAVKPGLGEYMNDMQVHHAKLWFAGTDNNWGLAKYELGEMDELMGNIIEEYPTHKGIAIANIMKAIRNTQLPELDSVIEKHGPVDKFQTSFKELNAACNGCHGATGHIFIKIQPPLTPPITNQDYEYVPQ
ncbi:MAG TPA: hypothetical protein VFA55_06555 [Candidatus Kapabacteria bacterium]|nr:hypothetical protein [Candidatus Kapabacteria bacterium]